MSRPRTLSTVQAVPDGLVECAREGCEVHFVPTRSDRIYCSESCSAQVRAKRQEAKR